MLLTQWKIIVLFSLCPSVKCNLVNKWMHYSPKIYSVYAQSCSSTASLRVENIELLPKYIVCCVLFDPEALSAMSKRYTYTLWVELTAFAVQWTLFTVPSLHVMRVIYCMLECVCVCVCLRVVDNRHCALHFSVLLKCRNGSHRLGHLKNQYWQRMKVLKSTEPFFEFVKVSQ